MRGRRLREEKINRKSEVDRGVLNYTGGNFLVKCLNITFLKNSTLSFG